MGVWGGGCWGGPWGWGGGGGGVDPPSSPSVRHWLVTWPGFWAGIS